MDLARYFEDNYPDTPATPSPLSLPAESADARSPEIPSIVPRQPTTVPGTFNILGLSMDRAKLEQSDAGKEFLQVQDRNLTGRRGFGEAITDLQGEDVPYIGDVITVRDILNVRDTFKKLESGAEVSEEERIKAAAYWADMERKSQQGVSGMVGDIVRQMPFFMAEIGTYSAVGAAAGAAPTGGLAAIPGAAIGGTVGAIKKGAQILTKAVLKESAEKAITKSMSKLIARMAGDAATTSAFRKGFNEFAVLGTKNFVLDTGVNAAANILQGQNVFDTAQGARRQLSNTLSQNPESDGVARMMGLGDRYIEYASEFTGGMIGAAFSPIGKAVGKIAGNPLLGKGEGEWLRKVMNLTWGEADVNRAIKAAGTGSFIAAISDIKNIPLDKAYGFLKTAGYHGMLEEMGEERVGGFMKGLLGIEGDEASLSNAFDQMIPDSEQLKAEAIAFAVPSVGLAAVRRGQIMVKSGITRFEKGVKSVGSAVRGTTDGVFVLNDKGDLIDKPKDLETKMQSFDKAAEDVKTIVDAFESTPSHGFVGKIFEGLLTVTEQILTGSVGSHQGPPGTLDLRLAERGIGPVGSVYALTRDAALKELAPEGDATDAIKERASKAGMDAVKAVLRADASNIMLQRSEVQSIIAKRKADFGDKVPTPEEAMQWLNDQTKGDNPFIRRVRLPVQGAYAWVRSDSSVFQAGDAKPGTPEAVREWAMSKAGAEILGTVFTTTGSVRVDKLGGDPATRGEAAKNAVRRMGLALDANDLNDMIQDPFSTKGIELSRAIGIPLTNEDNVRKFKSTLRYHQSTMSTISQSRAFTNEKTGVTFRLVPKPDAPGRYTIAAADYDSQVAIASSADLKPLRDLMASDSADLAVEVLKPENGGFVDIGLKPVSVNFLPATQYESKSAVTLLSMFSGYGKVLTAVDPKAREKQAARLITELGGRYNDATGTYYQPIGASNTLDEISVSLYRTSAYDFSEDAVENGWKRDKENRIERAVRRGLVTSESIANTYARGSTPNIVRLFQAINKSVLDDTSAAAIELRTLFKDPVNNPTEGLSKLANLYFFGFDYNHGNRAYAESVSEFLEAISKLEEFAPAMAEYMAAQGLMDYGTKGLYKAETAARMNPELDVESRSAVMSRITGFRWKPPATAAASKQKPEAKPEAKPSKSPEASAGKPVRSNVAPEKTGSGTGRDAAGDVVSEESKRPIKKMSAQEADDALKLLDEPATEPTAEEPKGALPAPVLTPPKRRRGSVSKNAYGAKTPPIAEGDAKPIPEAPTQSLKGPEVAVPDDRELPNFSLTSAFLRDRAFREVLLRFAADEDGLEDIYSAEVATKLASFRFPGITAKLISEAMAADVADKEVIDVTEAISEEAAAESKTDSADSDSADDKDADDQTRGSEYDGAERATVNNKRAVVMLANAIFGRIAGAYKQNYMIQLINRFVRAENNAPLQNEAAYNAWIKAESADPELETLKHMAENLSYGGFAELTYIVADQKVRTTAVGVVTSTDGRNPSLVLEGSESRASFRDVYQFIENAVQTVRGLAPEARRDYLTKIYRLVEHRRQQNQQTGEIEHKDIVATRLASLDQAGREKAVKDIKELLVMLSGDERVVAWFGDWVAKNSANKLTWDAFARLYGVIAFNMTPYSRDSVNIDSEEFWSKTLPSNIRRSFGVSSRVDKKTGALMDSALAQLWNDYTALYGDAPSRVKAPEGGTKSTLIYRDKMDDILDALKDDGHDADVIRIAGIILKDLATIIGSQEYDTQIANRNDNRMDSSDDDALMRAAYNSGRNLMVVPTGDKNLVLAVEFKNLKRGANFEATYEKMAQAYYAAMGAANMKAQGIQKRSRVLSTHGARPLAGIDGGMPDKVKIIVLAGKEMDGNLNVVGGYRDRMRTSSVRDAHIWKGMVIGNDLSDGFLTILKASHTLDSAADGSSFAELNAAIEKLGAYGYTDEGSAKSFSKGKEIQIVVGDVTLKGWEVNVPLNAFGETTNLEHTTNVEARNLAHPNMYDTAQYPNGRAAYTAYKNYLKWAIKRAISTFREIPLDDIDAERERYVYAMRAAGIPEGFPTISKVLRLMKRSRVRDLLRMPGYGAYHQLRPALNALDTARGMLRVTKSGAEITELGEAYLSKQGLFDFEKAGAQTKPATYRANLRGAGVRVAYKLKSGVDIAAARQAIMDYASAVRDADVDFDSTATPRLQALHKVVASMIEDEKGQAPSVGVNFEDLINENKEFDVLSERTLPDGSVWFGGHLSLVHRVPGGALHAAVYSRYWGPVTWMQSERTGKWVAGKSNDVVLHPSVVGRGGIDFDGDMAHIRMGAVEPKAFGRRITGPIDEAYETSRLMDDFGRDMAEAQAKGDTKAIAALELKKSKVEERVNELARIHAASEIFAAQISGFSRIPYAELTESIDKGIFNTLPVYDMHGVKRPLADIKKDEESAASGVSGATILSKVSNFYLYNNLARAGNLTKGIVVAEYRRMQTLLRQGVGFVSFTVNTPTGTIVSQRDADHPLRSDLLLHRLMQNLLNVVMDDLSDPTLSYLGLDKQTLPMFTTLAMGQNFKSQDDVEEFMKQWIEYAHSPTVVGWSKSFAARPYLTTTARINWLSNKDTSPIKGAAAQLKVKELTALFKANGSIGAASQVHTQLYTNVDDIDTQERIRESEVLLKSGAMEPLLGTRDNKQLDIFTEIGSLVREAMYGTLFSSRSGDPAVVLFPKVLSAYKDAFGGNPSRSMGRKMLERIRSNYLADGLGAMVATETYPELLERFYATPQNAIYNYADAVPQIGLALLESIQKAYANGEDQTGAAINPFLEAVRVGHRAGSGRRYAHSIGNIGSIDPSRLDEVYAAWDKLDMWGSGDTVSVNFGESQFQVPRSMVKPLIAFGLLGHAGLGNMHEPSPLHGLISPTFWKSVSDSASTQPQDTAAEFVKGNTRSFEKDGNTITTMADRVPATLRAPPKGREDSRRLAIVGMRYVKSVGSRAAGLYEAMYQDALQKVRPTDTLVSGGSTLADHIAVRLFNEGKVAGLWMAIPTYVDQDAVRFGGTLARDEDFVAQEGNKGRQAAAESLNNAHMEFSRAVWGLKDEKHSLRDIADASRKSGFKVIVSKDYGSKSLYARDAHVAAAATELLAYGVTAGTAPTTDGTLDTWNKTLVPKSYVPIAAAPARVVPTMAELRAKELAKKADTPAAMAKALGVRYDGTEGGKYDQYTFLKDGTPEEMATFYVPLGATLEQTRAAMEAKRKAFRDAVAARAAAIAPAVESAATGETGTADQPIAQPTAVSAPAPALSETSATATKVLNNIRDLRQRGEYEYQFSYLGSRYRLSFKKSGVITDIMEMKSRAELDQNSIDLDTVLRGSNINDVVAAVASRAAPAPAKAPTNKYTVRTETGAIVNLNEGQRSAVDKADTWLRSGDKKLPFVLSGQAGSGKTTVLSKILELIRASGLRDRSILFAAPTHTAKEEMNRRIGADGYQATTIASMLGMRPGVNLDEFDPSKKEFEQRGDILVPRGGVVVIDEASMLNTTLLKLILGTAASYGSRVVFVGDVAQLPAVGEEGIPAAFKQQAHSAELTEVMRTAGSNPLLEVFQALRAPIMATSKELSTLAPMSNVVGNEGYRASMDRSYFISQAVAAIKSSEALAPADRAGHVRILTGTNASVDAYNKEIRALLYSNAATEQLIPGELLMGYGGVSAEKGEDPVVQNGQVMRVESVSAPFKNTDGIVVRRATVTKVGATETKGEIVVVAQEGRAALADQLAALSVIISNKGSPARDAYTKMQRLLSRNLLMAPLPFKTPNGSRTQQKVLDYAIAQTVHKAQGAGINHVFVDANVVRTFGATQGTSADTRNRMMYTALTRARKTATVLYHGARTPTAEQPIVSYSLRQAESPEQLARWAAFTATDGGKIKAVKEFGNEFLAAYNEAVRQHPYDVDRQIEQVFDKYQPMWLEPKNINRDAFDETEPSNRPLELRLAFRKFNEPRSMSQEGMAFEAEAQVAGDTERAGQALETTFSLRQAARDKINEVLDAQNWPAALRKAIAVVHRINPRLPATALLSTQSHLAKLGVTDRMAVNWVVKNQKTVKLGDVKSAPQLRELAQKQLAARQNPENYPALGLPSQQGNVQWNDEGTFKRDNFDGWVSALQQYNDPFFSDMLMDIPLKDISNSRQERPAVPPVNKAVLRQVYDYALQHPADLGLAKVYQKMQAAVAVEAAETHERSASGKGEWVHVPRTTEPQPYKFKPTLTRAGVLRDERITLERENRMAPSLGAVPDLDSVTNKPSGERYFTWRAYSIYRQVVRDGANGAERVRWTVAPAWFSDSSSSRYGGPLPTAEEWNRGEITEVEARQRFQESQDLRDYNALVADTFNKYVQREARLKELGAELATLSNEPDYLPPTAEQQREMDLVQVKNDQRKANIELLRRLSPSTWCTHSWNAPNSVGNYDNYILVVDGKTVAGLEVRPPDRVSEGIPEEYRQPQPKLFEATSVANNGTASIEWLDDVTAFMDKHGIDYKGNYSISNARSLKAKGKTDADVGLGGDDPGEAPGGNYDFEYEPDGGVDYDPEGRALALWESHANEVLAVLDSGIIEKQQRYKDTGVLPHEGLRGLRVAGNLAGLHGSVAYWLTPEQVTALRQEAHAQLNLVHIARGDEQLDEGGITQAEARAEIRDFPNYADQLNDQPADSRIQLHIENMTGFRTKAEEAVQAGPGFKGTPLEFARKYLAPEWYEIAQSESGPIVLMNSLGRVAVHGTNLNRLSDLVYFSTEAHARERLTYGDLFKEVPLDKVTGEPQIHLEDYMYARLQHTGGIRRGEHADVLGNYEGYYIYGYNTIVDAQNLSTVRPVSDQEARGIYAEDFAMLREPLTKAMIDYYISNNPGRVVVPMTTDYGNYRLAYVATSSSVKTARQTQLDDERAYAEAAVAQAVQIDDLPFSKRTTGAVEGWATGDSAVVNAAAVSPENAPKVALHEVAHLGMIRLAKDLGGFEELHKLLRSAEVELLKAVPELLQRTGHTSLEELAIDYGFDPKSSEGEAKILVELAARWAERFAGKPVASWWKNLLTGLKDWFKKFAGMQLSESEVNDMVSGFVRYGAADYDTRKATAGAQPTSFSLTNSFNTVLDRVARNELERSSTPLALAERRRAYDLRYANYRKALDASTTLEDVVDANARHPEVSPSIRSSVLREAEKGMQAEDPAAYRNRFLADTTYTNSRYGIAPRTERQRELAKYIDANTFGGSSPSDVDHSLITADMMTDRLIAPFLSRGIPALHRALRNEANWYNKMHGRSIRWYENMMKEWGLFSSSGDILRIKEATEGIDSRDLDTGVLTPGTGRMLRYSANPLPIKKYAGKLSKEGQQHALLMHVAAKMTVEHLENDKPDYESAVMKSQVILNLPIAEKEMLKTLVPEYIAKILIARRDAVVAAMAASKASMPTAEYEHKLAIELKKAGVAAYVAVEVPHPSGDPDRKTWVAKDVVWSVPVQLIEDTFRGANGHQQSEAFKSLVAAGRNPARLSVRSLAKETGAMYDKMHEEINLHAPSIASGGNYLRYFKGYVPHQYGMGFLGLEETAVTHALSLEHRKIKDAERLKSYEISLSKAFDKLGLPISAEKASDKQLRYMLELKGLPFHSRDAALKALKSDIHRNLGIHKDMTLADIVHEINKDTLLVLERRQLARLEGNALNAPIPGTDITDPLALTKVTGKLLSSFKNREFSARTRRRKYANFADAYQTAGLMPNNTGLVDSLRRYVDDIGMQVRKEMWLNQAVMMTNPDGTPLIIPDPVEEFEGENVIKPTTWEALFNQLAGYTGYVRDPKKTTKENLKNLIDKFIVKNNTSYRVVESGHASIARYYTFVKPNGQENVMDMLAGGLGFSGGEVGNLVRHIVDESWKDPWQIIDTLEHANAWMKQMAMLGSFFFPIAGIESLVAATGGKALGKLAGRDNMSVWEFRQLIRGNHPYATDLLELAESSGIPFAYSSNPLDLPVTVVQKDVAKVAAEVDSIFGRKSGDAVRAVGDMLQGQSKFVFEDMFNSMKLWFVHNVLVEEREKAAKAGMKFSAKATLERWAPAINDALGGIESAQYTWLTPTMRRMLSLGMFSYGWTLAAWNVAGGGALTGPFLKNQMDPTSAKFVFLKNWPAMVAIVLVAAPAMLQAMTYAVSQAFGGGDDDEAKKMLERANADSPWIWRNEPGRQLYADITPLIRHSPFYRGDPTGDRRFYIHWGKQAWEVQGWLDKPWATFTGKLSQVARATVEQVTGETVGLGWDLGFKDMGAMGLFLDKEGGFGGSRLGVLSQKFAPFSILAMATSPDTAPLQMFGPVSKGISFGKATEAYTGYLKTWAERDTYKKVYKSPRIQANLEALGGDILKAATENGYDASKVIDGARAALLKEYYARVYKGIESQDMKAIEDASYSIARLNGTVEGVRRSVKNRNSLYGKPRAMNEAQLQAIKEAFTNPR